MDEPERLCTELVILFIDLPTARLVADDGGGRSSAGMDTNCKIHVVHNGMLGSWVLVVVTTAGRKKRVRRGDIAGIQWNEPQF